MMHFLKKLVAADGADTQASAPANRASVSTLQRDLDAGQEQISKLTGDLAAAEAALAKAETERAQISKLTDDMA
ncbi:MAG: hypothetical protein GY733_24235, partial [bacterium]|nr:hypothetical protein [bacterium]